MNYLVGKIGSLANFFEKKSPKGTCSLISNCALPIIGLVGVSFYARSQKTTVLALVARVFLNFEMTRMKMAGCAATSVFLTIFSTHDSLLGRISKSKLKSLGSLFYFYGSGRALLLHVSNKKIGAECFFAVGVGFFCSARPFLAQVISSLFFKALISLGFKNRMIYECLGELFQKQGDYQKAFECYFLAYFATNCDVSKNRLDEKLYFLSEVLKNASVGFSSYSKRASDFLRFMKGELVHDSAIRFYLEREETMSLRLKQLIEERKDHLMDVIDVAEVWQKVGQQAFVRNVDNREVVIFLIKASFFQLAKNLKNLEVIPEGKRRRLVLPFSSELIERCQRFFEAEQQNGLRRDVHSMCELISLISELLGHLKKDHFQLLPLHLREFFKEELRSFIQNVLISRCQKAVSLFLRQDPLSDEDLIELIKALKSCNVANMKDVLRLVLHKYSEKYRDSLECCQKGKDLLLACNFLRGQQGRPFVHSFYDKEEKMGSSVIRDNLTSAELLIWDTACAMISAKSSDEIRRILI